VVMYYILSFAEKSYDGVRFDTIIVLKYHMNNLERWASVGEVG